MMTFIPSHIDWILTKWDFSKKTTSNKSLAFVDKQIQSFLHFQQTLSIEAWPSLCIWVRIKAPTGLHCNVMCSLSRGSNSTFNDDVSDKTSFSFTHKERNCHCDGWGNIIVSSFILNIILKVKNRIWHKVKLHALENSTFCHCFSQDVHHISLFHVKY